MNRPSWITPPEETTDLSRMTWQEVDARISTTLLAIPLGSTEQHGPHLPLSVDTDIAVHLCRQLALRRDDVLVSPPIAFGSSGEHSAFAGTLSIGRDALQVLLVELVRSAGGFAGVVVVCGHGGNAVPLRGAVATLRAEGREVRAWMPRACGAEGDAGDSHAGHTETSVMLALHPSGVKTYRTVLGSTEPLSKLMPELVRSGVSAVSPNGVLGDPRSSNAADGEQILERWTEDLASAVGSWP